MAPPGASKPVLPVSSSITMAKLKSSPTTETNKLQNPKLETKGAKSKTKIKNPKLIDAVHPVSTRFRSLRVGSQSGGGGGSVRWAETFAPGDRKSTRLNSSHQIISYA